MSFTCVNSQSKVSSREMFLEAESYFLYEEYREALPLYVQLSVLHPNNDNINYRLGRCYLNIPYEKGKAISYLETASKNINPKYKGDNLKETKAPFDALYYLGDAYRVNNQLDKALAQYKRFKEVSNPAVFDHDLVNDQIKACENAKLLENKPIKISYVNLGENVNTRYSESNPVISGDESTLVYSAQLQFYPAVFVSQNINEKWSAPVNINPELGVDDDCYPVGLSYDGKELLLYRNNDFLGDLYVSHYFNGKWTKVKKLNNNINTNFWESHACLSRDGKKLYFTSNRKGTNGGLDIYVSTRKETSFDNWSVAKNLGPVINSPLNEETPCLSADGQKLYFSSLGHNGIGGYDIFMSALNAGGSWGIPQNIGYPLNTTDNDMFFQPIRDGNEGYISLFKNDSYGKNDIYKVNITVSNQQLATLNSKIKEPQVTLPVSEPAITKTEQNKNTVNVKPVTLSYKETVPQQNSDTSAMDTTSILAQNVDSTAFSSDSSFISDSAIVIEDKSSNTLDDKSLNPGQKQAWHKLLYGGLGILAVFTFFILFLYLRSKKRKH